MTPDEIVAKFLAALDNFESIINQPLDYELTRLREAIAPLLLQIPYDKTGGTHNLIGIIREKPAYLKRYGEAFPEATRVGAYDLEIDYVATTVIRARLEAANKARRVDRATFDTVRWETTQFVFAVVADTWVRELRDPETIYTDINPRDLLAHLQAGCTGRHALDLLVLHNEMERYHLEVEGIPEYINMLEDAQRQARQAGHAISDDTLLLFSSTEISQVSGYPGPMMPGRTGRNQTRRGWRGLAYKQLSTPPTSCLVPPGPPRHHWPGGTAHL